MLPMEFIAEIRRRHFVSGESISSIARSLKLSRPTVRKALKVVDEPIYQRQNQPTPKLGEFQKQLLDWMQNDPNVSAEQRNGYSNACKSKAIKARTDPYSGLY